MHSVRWKSWLAYGLGLELLALGIALMVQSDLGVSIGTSVSYVLSKRFPVLSLGVWNYLCHGAVLLLMMVLLRRARLRDFLSFFSAVLLGYSIDLWNGLLPVSLTSIWPRLLLLLAGTLCISLGIVLTFFSHLPPAPFELFVREVASAKGIAIAKLKTWFDLTFLGVGLLLSFFFFQHVEGFGIGTVLNAVTLGWCVGFFKRRVSPLFIEEAGC